MPVTKNEIDNVIIEKFGDIHKVTGTISAVLINDADNTLVPLITAPGAGKVIHVLETCFKLVYGTIPFSGGPPGDGHLNYSNGTQLQIVIAQSILFGTVDGYSTYYGPQFFTTYPVAILNTAVGLKIPNLIGFGDSTIQYEIIYKIVDFS